MQLLGEIRRFTLKKPVFTGKPKMDRRKWNSKTAKGSYGLTGNDIFEPTRNREASK